VPIDPESIHLAIPPRAISPLILPFAECRDSWMSSTRERRAEWYHLRPQLVIHRAIHRELSTRLIDACRQGKIAAPLSSSLGSSNSDFLNARKVDYIVSLLDLPENNTFSRDSSALSIQWSSNYVIYV